MTYRPDSDFPRPYGWIEPINRPHDLPPRLQDPPRWIPYNEREFKYALRLIYSYVLKHFSWFPHDSSWIAFQVQFSKKTTYVSSTRFKAKEGGLARVQLPCIIKERWICCWAQKIHWCKAKNNFVFSLIIRSFKQHLINEWILTVDSKQEMHWNACNE